MSNIKLSYIRRRPSPIRLAEIEASRLGPKRERVRCSSRVDWPVYPRLTPYAGIALLATSVLR